MIHASETGSIHSLITRWTRANQRCRLWGHVTSDLWWGCQLDVDMATRGRAAALYVLAWLKHNHTLLTQSQPVWGREGRAQGGCRRRPESRWRLRRHSMADRHNTCRQRGMHTQNVYFHNYLTMQADIRTNGGGQKTQNGEWTPWFAYHLAPAVDFNCFREIICRWKTCRSPADWLFVAAQWRHPVGGC